MVNRKPLQITDIEITDPLWSKRIAIARKVSINYMWDALNDNIPDVPPSHSITNFKIVAGLEKGEYSGRPFQDSDLYKWIEAASYAAEIHPDGDILDKLDQVVRLIEQAQAPDGYINTYTTLTHTPRFENLANLHELYCAGHLMEAAVAYKHATGNDRLINVSRRFADLAYTVFGPEEGKKHGYPGHQEIEIGLYKLYKETGEKKYLKLAKYFLDERGKKPYYFDIEQERRIKRGEAPLSYYQDHGPMRFSYQQAHLPVREQKIATGHAVRMVYMCSAMADVGRECDDGLLKAASDLYDNIVDTQMYLIGAIGSIVDGEALTIPYDIPNDRMYTETCASVGLMMLSQRLLNSYGSSKYADVIERALYNTILASTSEDGTKFFYTNPMEMWPERSRKRNDMKDIYPERQGWYVCACCPPNILRTLMSLGQYIYSQDEGGLDVNLYIGSTVHVHAENGNFDYTQGGDYIGRGKVHVKISGMDADYVPYVLRFRKPYWTRHMDVTVNGKKIEVSKYTKDGFVIVSREYRNGDTIDLEFEERAEFVYCSDKVPYNAGKVSLQYGPLIYCTEEIDNGEELWNLIVNTDKTPETTHVDGIPDGLKAFTVEGRREESKQSTDGGLYSFDKPVYKDQKMVFVPYFYWGNRRPGEEMNIWHLAQV